MTMSLPEDVAEFMDVALDPQTPTSTIEAMWASECVKVKSLALLSPNCPGYIVNDEAMEVVRQLRELLAQGATDHGRHQPTRLESMASPVGVVIWCQRIVNNPAATPQTQAALVGIDAAVDIVISNKKVQGGIDPLVAARLRFSANKPSRVAGEQVLNDAESGDLTCIAGRDWDMEVQGDYERMHAYLTPLVAHILSAKAVTSAHLPKPGEIADIFDSLSSTPHWTPVAAELITKCWEDTSRVPELLARLIAASGTGLVASAVAA